MLNKQSLLERVITDSLGRNQLRVSYRDKALEVTRFCSFQESSKILNPFLFKVSSVLLHACGLNMANHLGVLDITDSPIEGVVMQSIDFKDEASTKGNESCAVVLSSFLVSLDILARLYAVKGVDTEKGVGTLDLPLDTLISQQDRISDAVLLAISAGQFDDLIYNNPVDKQADDLAEFLTMEA